MEPTGAYIYNHIPAEYDSQTIAQKYPTIFDWFHTFDLNILIIISIMVIVGGVNMITAILVLILERTPMIGTLKALGATSWSIRKIFLYNAAYLIGLGLFWGNLIGLSLLCIQYYRFVLLCIYNLAQGVTYIARYPGLLLPPFCAALMT